MSHIPPSDVLAVCEAGSRLYNLAMPTSDTDYIVIYRHSTQVLISTPKTPKVVTYCTAVQSPVIGTDIYPIFSTTITLVFVYACHMIG